MALAWHHFPPLAQELFLVVGTVNVYMAERTLTRGLETEARMRHINGLWSDMALQAELALLPSFQQVEIDRAMGSVATRAPFHPDGGVLIDKRSPFLHVAGVARLGPRGLQSPSGQTAVRIVTIGAFNQAFIDPMPDGKLKLSLHIPVAGIAQLGLSHA